MKILVLQLARFGDVFMTWPILSALHRRYDGAEIHGLVRSRFKSALNGNRFCQKVIELPSSEWIESLLNEAKDERSHFTHSRKKVDSFIRDLKAEKYDLVLNFSFSPLSSYLTHALESENTRVVGYSRFADGSFRCVEAISQYFYDQVGETRQNRFHVIDLMASMADVDLIEGDFDCAPPPKPFPVELPSKFVLIQLGASQAKKSLVGFQWARLLKSLLHELPDFHFVLVGSAEEKPVSDEITHFLSSNQILSLVGQTELADLFPLLDQAEFALCTDSVLIQMANLKGTRTLSLSFETINFWETGPLAPGSAVLLSVAPETFEIQKSAEKIAAFAREEMDSNFYQTVLDIPRFKTAGQKDNDFNWRFILALYMNEKFPVCEDLEFIQVCTRMNDLNHVIVDGYESLNAKNFSSLSVAIERSEETLMALEKFHPTSAILVRWLQGRRLQVGPVPVSEVIAAYKSIHQELNKILKLYVYEETTTSKKEG